MHMLKAYITAELGKALAVVKVTSQVDGNTQFSGSAHPKTIYAIKMKFCTTDYVGKGNPYTHLATIELLGFLPMWVKYNLLVFFK